MCGFLGTFRPCQGTRTSLPPGADGKAVAGPYSWITYGAAQEMIDALGSALLLENLVPPTGELAVRGRCWRIRALTGSLDIFLANTVVVTAWSLPRAVLRARAVAAAATWYFLAQPDGVGHW